MSSIIMTVKLINQPGSTGRGSIVGTNDERLGVFPEKIGLFQVGRTYEVEFTETDRGGRTLRNVKSAKPVATPAAADSAIPARDPFVSGAYRRPEAAAPANPSRDEQIFVQGLLQAFIRAGKVEPDKAALWSTTQMLRGLYRATFAGPDGVTLAAESRQPRLVAAE